MSITKLSDLGGIVCVDGRENELIFNAKSDGAAKPGHGVMILADNAVTIAEIVKHDITGTTDKFVGILLPKYNADCDSAITDHEICEIVVPSSGHKYNIKCADQGGAAEGNIGTPVRFHATIGGEWLVGSADLEVKNYCATVSKETAQYDLFVEVIWRA